MCTIDTRLPRVMMVLPPRPSSVLNKNPPRAVVGSNALRPEQMGPRRVDKSSVVSTRNLWSEGSEVRKRGSWPATGSRGLSAITSISHEMRVAILPLLTHEINLSLILTVILRVLAFPRCGHGQIQ